MAQGRAANDATLLGTVLLVRDGRRHLATGRTTNLSWGNACK